DAVFYLNIGSHYIERGGLTPYMWRLPDDSNIIAGSGTGYGILLLTEWLRVFGLTFTAGRVLMYLLGIATIFAMFAMVRVWYGLYAGVVAAGLWAVSTTPFFSFQLRMDSPGMLAYALALWLHVSAVKSGKLWQHFATAVALVLCAQFHILAVMYIGAVTFYYVIDLIAGVVRQRGAVNWRPFAAYALGGALAGGIYIAVQVLPNPEAYFLIAQDCPACVPAGLEKEIARYRGFFRARPFEVILLGLAIVAAVWRWQPRDRHWLLLLIGAVLSYAVVSPPSQVEYIAHTAPLTFAGIAALFIPGFRRRKSALPHRYAVLAAQAVLLLLLGINNFRTNLFSGIARPDFPPIVTIRELDLPRDTVIMGEFRWYGDLLDYPLYLQYGTEEQYGMTLRGEDYLAFWARERPQVFIGDPSGDALLVDYMAEYAFVEMQPGLWLDGDLCADHNCDGA
ncbi:MAG: glycosyltransferase family 39 protein, partial [Chloroflexota bacterium]